MTHRNGHFAEPGEFVFTLNQQASDGDACLTIESPTGIQAFISVHSGEAAILLKLVELQQSDLANPTIDPKEAGRRFVKILAQLFVWEPNTISKYVGNLLKRVAAKTARAFPGEVADMPALISVVPRGPRRGHRLNVPLEINYLAGCVGRAPRPEPALRSSGGGSLAV